MNVRLSVIIPGYNTPTSQRQRCVSSVLNACGPDDEVICIDDGSSIVVDECNIFPNGDKRARLLRKRNGGLSSARNYALGQIRGKYVTFVDSDDAVEKETYNKCIAKLEHSEADIAIYGVDVIWVREGLHKIDKLPDKYYGVLTSKDIQEIFQAELLNYACNKVYRSDFIMGVKGHSYGKITFHSEGMPCEDIIFNLECIMRGAKWISVDYVGYFYYRDGDSLLSRYKKTNTSGYKACKEAWHRCCKSLKDDQVEIIQNNSDLYTDKYIAKAEWKNIWLPGSPYSISERWGWCIKNPHIECKVFVFVKMLIFTLCRKYLYLRPIRKMHIKRLNPTVKRWTGE